MDKESIEWLLANNVGPIKYFAGYSGWGKGQLDNEINEGAWMLAPASEEHVYEGKADKGISLMEQGIKKGGLKRPDDAKLRLGEAQLYAGKKNAGVATLRDVKGTDGTGDMARLWILNARA